MKRNINSHLADNGEEDTYIEDTYCHEIGHYINNKLIKNSSLKYSNSYGWTPARKVDSIKSKQLAATEYGRNLYKGNFAESMKEYTRDWEPLEKNFPARAKTL